MTTLISIDPGLSSGVFVGHHSDTEPLTRLGVFQFTGGVQGLLDFFSFPNYVHERAPIYEYREVLEDFPPVFRGVKDIHHLHSLRFEGEIVYICEKFTPLTGRGFALTLDSVEPLRAEGALIAKGFMAAEFPHESWQRPAVMYSHGGSTLPEKKKASRAWLKKHDLLPTGKTVGQPDANDAVSATLHAFAYMRKIGHLPTLKHYYEED